MVDLTPLEKATQAQRMAADPSGTRLAAANAGSGKTRVLVSRVSRILLRGTDPADILCLTYTKAAAAEMQERLFSTLGSWSVMADAPLRKELTELFGQAPENETPPVTLETARELFAKALETPEGLKVQTIHAFCERILSRFPIEAGILPRFEPLDDVEILNLRREVERQILIESMESPEGNLATALRHLTLAKADQSLDGLYAWMAQAPQKVGKWVGQGLDDLATSFKIGELRDPDLIAEQLWSALDKPRLTATASALESGGATDKKRAALIRTALSAPTALDALASLKFLYFKKSAPSEHPAKFYDKGTDDLAKHWIDEHALDIIEADERLRGAYIFRLTKSVQDIAARYADLYREMKHKARGLDYSDQILFARRLLQNAEASDWVRYKLDGGISHILLDEAQDTAPEQWDIINTLAEPFFQPHPDDDPNKPRTLFAVGDEKQSIYGFQGARPEQFLTEIRRRSEQATTDIRMRMSFRSTQQVLDVVDAFLEGAGGLQAMFDAEEFPPASDKVSHIAHRKDQGLVELWPITPAPEKAEEREPWDTTPVDSKGQTHQIEILAKTIAAQVKGWIDNAAPIYDRDLKRTRPTRPQDVLVLVRRRGALFDALIRQLKRHEIPIAGADRLVLSEAIIVKDLLSLSRFCLLPSDDFSLAEVLKSPIIGYDDAQLMGVAIGREGTLFEALKTQDPDVANLLQDAIKAAQELTPFDFYARFLDLEFRGMTIRKRFYKRLSLEARDALEAFLDQALDHQTHMAPNLQSFLTAFAAGDVQIKRELDGNISEVRVMTVHGAKGLEAPIVILPDTTSVPKEMDVLLPDGQGGYVWKPSSAGTLPYVETLKTASAARTQQEQLRLLYVAMTRAESKLIICGPHVGGATAKLKAGCWYDWVSRAMAELETTIVTRQLNGEDVDVLTFGGQPEACEQDDKESREDAIKLEDWMFQPAAVEGRGQHVTPSHLLSDPPVDMAVRSPKQTRDASMFLRGNLTHKLLEVLPEFPVERRHDIATRLVASHKNLPEGLGETVLQEVFAVLNNPDFASIFAQGSQAEVSLAGSAAGLPDHLYLNAQIDRLCVTETEVFIVDYKSNRPPPENPEDVSDLYLGQMAAYRELAREIYPDRAIKCALLWTDGPHLMVLPKLLLDNALQKIAELPIS